MVLFQIRLFETSTFIYDLTILICIFPLTFRKSCLMHDNLLYDFSNSSSTSAKMASLRTPFQIFCSVKLVIQVILFVSLCHSAFANNTKDKSYSSLRLANDTLVKYKNQTLISANVKSRSRRKRSVIFPTGSDLTFTVSLQFPIAALSATSKCTKLA